MLDLPAQMDLDNIEFQFAYQLITQTEHSLFLTGRAGTGKSTFLRYLQQHSNKKMVTLAPTGIAAVNVGGTTIHSFFGFPLRPLLPNDHAIHAFGKKSEKRKIVAQMDTLIIDEVSMLRADLVDAIDASLRKNGGEPSLPFGGKQVIFIGDIFQLEPVVSKDKEGFEILREHYKSFFFFDAKVFEELDLVSVELQKIYRQTDLHFIELLEKVRKSKANTKDLSLLNQRYVGEDVESQSETTDNEQVNVITLTTTNKLSQEKNQDELENIDHPAQVFTATVAGDYEASKYPTDYHLTLKQGAQVMFVRNDAQRGRWANGTIGTIDFLSKNTIKVKLENGEVHKIEPEEWDNKKYTLNGERSQISTEVLGTYTQYPLKLAWAVTIHKSQGLTFDRVHLNLGRGAFASGQLYVALSRCRTFEGLSFQQKIKQKDMFLNFKIQNFAKNFKNTAQIKKLMNELEKEFTDKAKAKYTVQNYQGALESIEKALSFSPENAILWSFLGNVCQKMEEFEEAIQHYGKALDLAQKNYGTETALKLTQKIARAQQEMIEKLLP